MEFKMKPYIVYVKTNSDNYIIAVNSSAFLVDVVDWIKIDSGYGDKYCHAQGNYFPQSIATENMAYRYKLIDGLVIECSADEIIAQESKFEPVVKPTPQEDTDAMLIDHEYRLTMLELFSDITI